ncbi:MAG: hypothetical protein P8H88_01120, partial [Flavobacteriales bacterium]|nr:hypothetical protein [Flavobacteriales bacterium]
IGLGLQLYQTNQTVVAVQADNTAISFERDQVLFDLEKLSFSYDTLSTENALMLAQIADQKNDIGRLVQQVKNGNWSLARAKQEAETLRGIMKGYVATIDSLNQLNLALLGENLAMKEQMEAVSQENADLVERQENMEEMLEAGQTLQVSELNPVGVRVLSSGRQRDTDRADRSDMLRVCFTILENRIAPVGSKTLHLRITDSDGNLLPSEDEATDYSASRTLDYARERLDACIFYASSDDSMEGAFRSGTYLVEVLEGETVIGTTDLILR